ncbi:cell wall-binding repeat-containing protein [Peptacetobacter sp.]|uniref:cell wall-binding repeat-containing protein n=1 Tax=Peptacetobacter sp. TaxID=2991975 RepID=UPI00263450BD|nr:cell wall-binding repeat-containing protein [Peptacetobacter sp.]
MKKKITAILMILILGIIYLFSGKVINKLYLRGYEKEKIQGKDRYETIIQSGEKIWKNPKKAILMSTNEVGDAINAVPYSYNMNMPLLLTETKELPADIYSYIKDNKLEEVYIVGGINKVSKPVERNINRMGIKTTRIIGESKKGVNILFAQKVIEKTKSKSMFVIFDGKNGYSIGVSLLGKASEKGIPILTANESNIYNVIDFAKKNKIEKTYVIGRYDDLNSVIDKLLPNVERISGKNKFEVNRNVVEKFYDMKKIDKVYITKGGTLIKGKTLNIGEFVNGIAVAPILAKTNQPLLINDINYLQKDTKDFIDKYNIKKICTVGFEMEKTNLINLSYKQSQIISSIIIIIMMIVIAYRALRV